MTWVGDTVEQLRSISDAEKARGAVVRSLESYPDQPGLLLLRAITESLTSSHRSDVIREHLHACVRFAREKYAVGIDLISEQICRSLIPLEHSNPKALRSLVRFYIIESGDADHVSKSLLSHSSSIVSSAALEHRLKELRTSIDQVIQP